MRIDRGRVSVASRPALRVAPAPAIVRLPPRPDETPIGEKQGNGDAISRVDLPDVTRAPDPRDFEQAWTRQRPSMPMPESTSTPLGPLAPKTPVAPPAAEHERPPPQKESAAGTVAATTDDEAKAKPRAAVEVKPAAPPSREQKADPADAGPSDLDAFAKNDGVEFTRGGVEARTGRPVKLARPRVDFRFIADATARSGHSLSVELQIDTDATGAAKNVRVTKSSGSEPIDDAIRLAMYDSWFGGKMPDSFPFGVTLWK